MTNTRHPCTEVPQPRYSVKHALCVNGACVYFVEFVVHVTHLHRVAPPSTTPTYEDHLYTYVVQSGTTLSLPLGVATNSTARWLWNAQLVSLGSKYSISPGDQRLVIRDVQPGDSGVYQGGVQVTQGGQDIDVLATYEITVYCEYHAMSWDGDDVRVGSVRVGW